MTDPIRWLPHLWGRLYGGQPLLIPLPRLEPLLTGFHAAMLQRGSSDGGPPALADPASPTASGNGSDERPHGYRIDHGVATLPVHGVLASRVGKIAADSTPLQSYENVSRVLHNAHRDSRVRGILLDIDSPGGEAAGAFDLADQIRNLGQTKPIWAIANHDALSAGYLLASAADRVWTTQSGVLGSIGVVALHADRSEFDRHEGVRYTYISRGERKLDGNPHNPLSPEAHTTIQAVVDREYARFLDYGARHRHVDPRSLQATEARIYSADEALGQRLADHVGRLDQAHAALAQYVTPRARGTTTVSELPPVPAAESIAEAADNVVQLRVDAEVKAELERCSTIAGLCNQHHVPDMIQALQADRRISVDAAARQILERKAQDDSRRQLTAIDPSVAAARQRSMGAEVEEAAKARFAAQRRGLYNPE